MKQQPPKILSYLLPTFSNALWVMAFFGVIISGRGMMNADGDLGRHLTLGHHFIDQRTIPLQDLFSHTMAGQTVTPHEWLVQLIFAFAERLFGLNGVILVCALVIACAFGLVFKFVREESKTLIVPVLVICLTMITSKIHWLARPHIFTFLFLAAWMTVLLDLRKGNHKRWWLLPLLMALWANLHGAFIAGFVTYLIYGIGVLWDQFWGRSTRDKALPPHFWRNYLLGGGTALGASLLNPTGIGLWQTSFGYIGNRYLVGHTVEYLSPNFHRVMFWPFLLMIGLLVISLGASKKRIETGLLLNAAAWLMMGLYSARNIPLFTIVAALPLAQSVESFFITLLPRIKLLNKLKQFDIRLQLVDAQLKGFLWPGLSVVIVAIGLASGFHFDLQGQGYAFDPEVFPVAAVDWLEENPQEGEMFNYFTWGGYLLYRQWPERRVFIDGQTDFYGEAFTRQYAQVIKLEAGWEEVLDQYHVAWAILPPDQPAVRALQTALNWEAIFEDETTVILRRY